MTNETREIRWAISVETLDKAAKIAQLRGVRPSVLAAYLIEQYYHEVFVTEEDRDREDGSEVAERPVAPWEDRPQCPQDRTRQAYFGTGRREMKSLGWKMAHDKEWLALLNNGFHGIIDTDWLRSAVAAYKEEHPESYPVTSVTPFQLAGILKASGNIVSLSRGQYEVVAGFADEEGGTE